ncbi:MAG: winged helix-turn-helix transcriptional regulator [Dehalococcoidia bacterium]|nr:winged helix-turn-helix transcriptional regulator [Dehalococcoidia bacterium]
MSLERCVALFHHRWAVPVVATMQNAGRPLSAAEAAARLGASRAAVREALEDLREKGVVVRQPGPRGPYAFTAMGEHLAPGCQGLGKVVRELGALPVALRKWSMPVIIQVGHGCEHYNELLATLPGVTPRALALALKEALAAGLIERRIDAGYPPSSRYVLTERAATLYPALEVFSAAVDALDGPPWSDAAGPPSGG